MKGLVTSIARLGAGEAVARLASFGLYAFISRKYGLELVAILALAQTIATYVTMGTDQGLRLIGARLVARDPRCSALVIHLVLRKRLISCVFCVTVGCAYALWGPVPGVARYFIVGFVLAVIPYAFSLDWLAWGLNRIGWLGAWRAGVALLFVTAAVAGLQLTTSRVLVLTISNAVSAAAGAAVLWLAWRKQWKPSLQPISNDDAAVLEQLRWGIVLPLGMAAMLTLIFNNFDTVILAGMSTVTELGRYSAAYKILFMIFGSYYLFTQSLYPKLSGLRGGGRVRRLLPSMLFVVSLAGAFVAIILAAYPTYILRLVYGSDFDAAGLLRVLSIAVPMDFCAALMGIVLVSRGFDRAVLKCAGAAAVLNILLNLALIPRIGAMGAAWSTVASYVVLVGSLMSFVFRRSIFSDEPLGGMQTQAVENPA